MLTQVIWQFGDGYSYFILKKKKDLLNFFKMDENSHMEDT